MIRPITLTLTLILHCVVFSSKQFMYRLYNGCLYQKGKKLKDKVGKLANQGDVVDFVVHNHTVSIIVNGDSQGVCFDISDVETIYPSVCFYKSGREVELVQVLLGEAVTPAHAAAAKGVDYFSSTKGGWEISGDKKSVMSTVSEDSHAVVGMAIPGNGRGTWSFKIEADKEGSEKTALGFTTKYGLEESDFLKCEDMYVFKLKGGKFYARTKRILDMDDDEVSNVKCHFSTIIMIIMHQFEDMCHDSMH